MTVTTKCEAQYTFEHASGDAEQNLVHRWAFLLEDGNRNNAAGTVNTALLNFYNTIDAYLSNDFTGSNEIVRWYDLADPPKRVPFRTDALAQPTVGTTKLPGQCSIVLSFKGAYTSGVNPARRRGRLYFGPLAVAAINTSTGRVDATVQAAISGAMTTLIQASNAATSWVLCIHSRASDQFVPVIGGWIDNSVDIQRRRKNASTSRINLAP